MHWPTCAIIGITASTPFASNTPARRTEASHRLVRTSVNGSHSPDNSPGLSSRALPPAASNTLERTRASGDVPQERDSWSAMPESCLSHP